MLKFVLVVAHYEQINVSRATLVKNAGFDVLSAASDDEAMALLDCNSVDLVLIGRTSLTAPASLDQRIREKCPNIPILKVEGEGLSESAHTSRVVSPNPVHIVAALQELLA